MTDAPAAPAPSPALASVPVASPAPNFIETLMAANKAPGAPAPTPAPATPPPAQSAPQPPPAAPAVPSAQPSPPPAPEPPPPASPSTENPFDALMKGEIPKQATNPGLAPTDPNSREFQTWKELRAAYDTQIKEAADLKRQLAETAARVPQDYEDVKKMLTERDAKLAQLDLTQRPEYLNVVQPMSQIMQTVRTVAEKYKVNMLHVDAAMHADNFDTAVSELSAVFENAEIPIPAHISAMIMAKTEEFIQRGQAAQEYLAQAPAYMARIREQEQAQEQQRQEARKVEFSRASEQALEIVKQHVPEVATPELLNTLRASTQADWNTLKPVTQAYLLMAGNMVPKLQEAVKAQSDLVKAKEAELASVRSQLERLTGAMPSTNGAPQAQPASSPEDQSLSFSERLARAGNLPPRAF